MITINNQRSKNSRLHLVACNRNQKIQGYISLHVTKMNNLHCIACISHVISCIISRHFMLHFASFHVIFSTFHCTHHTHRTHVTHVAHFAFHEQRAFHALHHISRHFMYHFMLFHHGNLFHTHSYHLGLKREEIGSKCHLNEAFFKR